MISVEKTVALHETRFAVRAESDKRIYDKFEHIETKMDAQHSQLRDQSDALKSALLRVAFWFMTGSAAIIVGVVAFVLTGVVKIG